MIYLSSDELKRILPLVHWGKGYCHCQCCVSTCRSVILFPLNDINTLKAKIFCLPHSYLVHLLILPWLNLNSLFDNGHNNFYFCGIPIWYHILILCLISTMSKVLQATTFLIPNSYLVPKVLVATLLAILNFIIWSTTHHWISLSATLMC